MIRRLLFLFLAFAVPAFAQVAVVSGTVTDINGLAYSNASLTINLSTPSGTNGVYLLGKQIGGSVGPVQLDNTGSFLVQLAENTFIQCGNTQGQIVPCVPQTVWNFTVTLSPGVARPLGTGSQTCTSAITISSLSQSVSGNFACPALSNPAGGSAGPAANQINVKTCCGAQGTFQVTQSGQANINGTSLTLLAGCQGCAFTPTDVGQPSFFTVGAGFTTYFTNQTIIAFNSSTNVTINASFGATNGLLGWGPLDDTAIAQAVTLFNLAFKGVNGGGALGKSITSPTLYFPTGTYGLLNTQMAVNTSVPHSGGAIRGDGSDQSTIVAVTGYSQSGGVLNISGNLSSITIQGLTFDGMVGQSSSADFLNIASPNNYINDINIERYQGNCFHANQAGGFQLYNVRFVQCGQVGFLCQVCTGEMRSSVVSNNNGTNVTFNGVIAAPGGQGFRTFGVFGDECGTTAGCWTLINSNDVWLNGAAYFGTPTGFAISVDGTSYLHINGGLLGVFSLDTNTGGLQILSGGVVEASDVRLIASGTGKCLNNAGTFINNGNVSCESQFASITSATSAGNTATLTVTTQGANVSAVCAVGDTAYVEKVGVAGYNGVLKNAITAVGTNTVSYTTPGSNLGASSGGSFFCRGITTFTGNVPFGSLAPSQFNCLIPTLTATTTTGTTNCFFTTDRDIHVDRFSAGLGTTPAGCTTPAVLQLANGTNTQNLTIANGNAQDDTGALSTPTIFVKNTKVGAIVSTAASGCTTSPANASINVLWHVLFDGN